MFTKHYLELPFGSFENAHLSDHSKWSLMHQARSSRPPHHPITTRQRHKKNSNQIHRNRDGMLVIDWTTIGSTVTATGQTAVNQIETNSPNFPNSLPPDKRKRSSPTAKDLIFFSSVSGIHFIFSSPDNIEFEVHLSMC